MKAGQGAREGAAYAIPLATGGHGVGVVSQASRSGVLVVHLFREFGEHAELRPTDAIAVVRAGGLGVRNGSWRMLGDVVPWDEMEWHVTRFVRYEELTGRSFEVLYDEDDPNRVLIERLIAPGADEHGPTDDLLGHKYVENMLTRVLAP